MERDGGTGPQQPSQAEGDRETVEQDIAGQQGGGNATEATTNEPRSESTPAARSPERRPSQAEGERS